MGLKFIAVNDEDLPLLAALMNRLRRSSGIYRTQQAPLHIFRRRRTSMIISDRLRALREEKKFSQGDVEKRTGLFRAYISRVENNHGVPNIETLEKWARALEVPMYQLFYDGAEPPKPAILPKGKSDGIAWGSSGKDARFLTKLRRLLGKANEQDRKLLLHIAQKMARR
jgi:transcriptional regulator with XRE-family HTH domain